MVDEDPVPAPPARVRWDTARWIGVGMIAGFLAGVALAALNAWFATSNGMGALAPFRTIATIVQGPPLATATIWVGMLLHSLIAAGLGVIFAGLLLPARRRSVGWSTWAGLVYASDDPMPTPPAGWTEGDQLGQVKHVGRLRVDEVADLLAAGDTPKASTYDGAEITEPGLMDRFKIAGGEG